MTVLEAMPANPNPLQVNGYRFWVRKFPNLDFYVQQARIPPVQLPAVKNPTPFIENTIGGDHLDFGDLSITWMVDEGAKSFVEVYNWLRGVGYPVSYDQYKELFDQKPWSGLGLSSEALLIVLDSKKRPAFQYVFQDCSPTGLSVEEFDTTGTDIKYMQATATFNFTDYVIEYTNFNVDNG